MNLVLEFVPETVYRVARHYSKSKQTIPLVHVKVLLNNTVVCLLFKVYFVMLPHSTHPPEYSAFEIKASVVDI